MNKRKELAVGEELVGGEHGGKGVLETELKSGLGIEGNNDQS